MIELILPSRCIGCDQCGKVCPTNVFDFGNGELPTIARAEDCQTCFLCEAYCPADALYVGPSGERREHPDEATVLASGLLGRYREILGWGPGRVGRSEQDGGYLLKTLRGFGALAGTASPAAVSEADRAARP
jgi:NAD-dependent dihydropyrimidine dehydrogenase PreA subunit